MLNKNNKKNDIATKLSLPFSLNENNQKYYKSLHANLSKMRKNQLSIKGVNMEIRGTRKIIVTVFIRSTVEKSISLKPSKIVLLDENLEIFASTREDFIGFGILSPDTSKPCIIEFTKNDLKNWNKNRLNKWSVVFENSLKHRLDLSAIDETKISRDSIDKISKIIKKDPIDEDELRLTGLSAKLDKGKNLVITLLIRNGSNKDLEIKQLPLEFYDCMDELSAKGIFRLEDLILLGNTSKIVSLVFPYPNIIKKNMDLSKWSILYNK